MRFMDWKEGIFFKEIKSYEEAYYYNSDPNNREIYKKDTYEVKDVKGRKWISVLLEIIFNVI